MPGIVHQVEPPQLLSVILSFMICNYLTRCSVLIWTYSSVPILDEERIENIPEKWVGMATEKCDHDSRLK